MRKERIVRVSSSSTFHGIFSSSVPSSESDDLIERCRKEAIVWASNIVGERVVLKAALLCPACEDAKWILSDTVHTRGLAILVKRRCNDPHCEPTVFLEETIMAAR